MQEVKAPMQIKTQSKAHLSVKKAKRQERRPEDAEAIATNWEATFGKDCEQCGTRHARHTPCPKG